jgi:hypothetical protein
VDGGIRKRELDFGRGIREGRKEKSGRREIVANFCGFLLVDWCCWDFGLGGQEI